MPIPDLVAPAVSGGVVVRDSADPTTPDGFLQIAPNYPFFLTHYPLDPGAWHVATISAGPGVSEDEVGAWWLPVLTRLPCRPGLCGHRTKKAGMADAKIYQGAHNRVVERRGRVLPRALGYMVEKACQSPTSMAEGTFYLDPWSSPRVKLQNKRQRFSFDRQRYLRWLLALIRSGDLDEPHPDVVDVRRGQIAKRVGRRAAEGVDLPDRQRERFLGEAEEASDLAAEAVSPQTTPRGASFARDSTDPEQMTYQELQAAARSLGWRTAGVKTDDLRAIVRAGDPFDDDEEE